MSEAIGSGDDADLNRVEGLQTDQMQGAIAIFTMSGLDFDRRFAAIEGDYPVLRPVDSTLTEVTVDGEASSVESTSPHEANGTDQSELTVTVVDSANKPIDGVPVSFFEIQTNGSAQTETIAETETAGVYRANVTNEEAERIDASVSVDGTLLGESHIEFRERIFFEPTIDATNSPILEDEQLNVTISVENIGLETDSQTVALNVSDETVDSTTVDLDSDETEEFTLRWQAEPGDNTIDSIKVATANASTSQSVEIKPVTTVSGTLTDGVSGDTLEGVTVGVLDSDRETETNSDGAFELTVADGESATLTASTTPTDTEITNTTDVSVDGETTQNLTLWPELAGDGSAETPHEVSTAYELQAITRKPTATYILTDSIDAAESSSWNSGDGFVPLGTDSEPFTGSITGNGETVSNLTITRTATGVGLVGHAESATVTDLQLVDLTVEGDSAVGGLVGVATNTTLATLTVSGSVEGDSAVGGVAGTLDNTTLSAAIGTAAVTGSDSGGLVGTATDAEIDAAYWDREATGQDTSAGSPDSMARNTREIQGASARFGMAQLNFEGTFRAVERAYPALQPTDRPEATIDAGSTVSATSPQIANGTDESTVTMRVNDSAGDPVVGIPAADFGIDLTGNATPGTVTDTEKAGVYTVAVTNEEIEDTVATVTAATTQLDDTPKISFIAPAFFEVTITETNAPVVEGESLAVTTTVENIRNENDSQPIELRNFSGEVVDSTTVSLAGDESTTVELRWQTQPGENGTADINVTSSDSYMTETVEVIPLRTVSGTVTDGVAGEPLGGITVDVVGETASNTTAGDGSYELILPDNTTDSLTATTTADGVEITNTTEIEVDGATTQNLALWPELDGDGTETTPYRITNSYELQAVSQNLTANYTVEGTVDAVGTGDWNNGDGFRPIGTDSQPFAGSFDGDGSVISGVTISHTNEAGLFGNASAATITDIHLQDATVDGDASVGGLIGVADSVTLSTVSVDGRVNGSTAVGGIVGDLQDGSVSASAATATVSGESSVGGLVGRLDGTTVSNASASGSSSGNDSVGGLVGHAASGTVETSIATGPVDGSGTDIGGLIGSAASSTVADAYWDTEATGQLSSAGGSGAVGLTTAEMTGQNATRQLDGVAFESVWTATDSYPVLGWSVTDLDLAVGDTELQEGDSTAATVELARIGPDVTASTTSSYTTSTAGVLAVENGVVTARSAGTTQLTAERAGLTDSVSLSVSAPPTAASSRSSRASASAVSIRSNGEQTVATVDNSQPETPVVIRSESGGSLSATDRTSLDQLTVETTRRDRFELRLQSIETVDPTDNTVQPLSAGESNTVGYFRIDHDLRDEEITAATIDFSVLPAAIQDEATDSTDEIRLYRYTDAGWTQLPTNHQQTADGVRQYTATTPGFSLFAIGTAADEQPSATAATDRTDQTQPTAGSPTSETIPGFGPVAAVVSLVAFVLLCSRWGRGPRFR